MSNAWRTLAAMLTTLLLAAGASIGALALAGSALASSAPADIPAAGPPIIPNPHFVRLRIDAITPNTITSATTGPVTARGLVINDGDRDVHNLQVRLERAPRVQTATELRAALRSAPTELSTEGAFTTVSDKLSPGESVPFSVSLPLSGNLSNSLGLTEPGVYPMLVNVNGEPDFGGRARLDVAHFLLPALSLPPDPTVSESPASKNPASTSPGSTIPAPPRTPTGMTLLWPLAARPRLLPSALGAPALLSDDELAASFAVGGRLDGLLRAVEQRTTLAADPTGALGNTLCLGVDPDLLVTAEDMTRGYGVAGVDGKVTPGAGGAAAGAWLARLKVVSKQRCVLALPWAQADVNALSRASLNDLEGAAVGNGSQVVATSLALPAVAGVVWPDGRFLAEHTAADLRTSGVKSVLVSSDGVDSASGSALPSSTRTAHLDTAGGSLGVGLIDAASAAALATTGAGDDRQLRLQDALGAIAWPAITTSSNAPSGEATSGGIPSSLLITPPQVWGVDATAAQELLGEVSALLQSGAAIPQPLPTVLDRAATATTKAQLDYPIQAASAEVPTSTTAAISRASADLDRFAGALQRDPQSGVSPDDLLAPLRLGLLRSASTSAASTSAAAGDPEVDAVEAELTRLHDGIYLQAPGGTYTLASAQSPLLLVVRNDLPVSVSVRLTVDAPAGLRTTDIGVQQLPARSSRQLQVPTTVSRTGQFAVDVSLATETGQQLGGPARLQVRSTAYGPATALATAGAAIVLLALVARRLWHRFRGQPDRADEQQAPT